MRSILFSSALVFATVACSGCASIKVDQACDVDQACASDCCQGRVGGLLGIMRGERACQDCGDANCQSGDCGQNAGLGGTAIGGGRLGAGGFGGRMGAGMGGRGLIGGRGLGAGMRQSAGMGQGGGMGLGGACGTCGMMGGNCRCIGNHAPYTPEFNGPPGPMSATYSYPYYTTRAPRDFLMANPPSIGR